ncbi:MAG: hypothetical protein ACXIVL_07785 [Oceanicaulis sp.]
MNRWSQTIATALASATLGLLPAAAAAQSGPWQHAREPRDRSLSCEALESEIGEIDRWRADSRGVSGGSPVNAQQGITAAEVAARRTGNQQASGMMRDAQRLFGGNQRRQQTRPRGPDPDRVAEDRRHHLMGLYERNRCAAALGDTDQASAGPWLAAHMPRDPALTCDALEAEIGHIDTFISGADPESAAGAAVDPDQALEAGQSVAQRTRNYETSGVLGDARRVLGAGRQPVHSRDRSNEDWPTAIAYDRRDHLMDLFERRDCW